MQPYLFLTADGSRNDRPDQFAEDRHYPESRAGRFLGSRTLDGNYAAYLREMRAIYAQLRDLLKPGGRAIINAANIAGWKGVTPLAWDLAAAVGEVLRFEREIVLCWDQPAPYFTNEYCLVFVND